MMPSRGWQWSRSPRLYQLQCRNLSSASNRIHVPSSAVRPPIRPHLRPSQWRIPTPLMYAAAFPVRHASGAPIPPPQRQLHPPAEPASAGASTPFSPAPSSPETFPNLDTISLEGIDLDSTAQIPEKIGYLHEIGIDYGYGFTSMIQWTVEHLHIMGGLPWWGSIAATAVLMRLVLFPLYLKSSDSLARQAALGAITKPINKRMQVAKDIGDQQEMLLAFQELMAVRKRAGISLAGQFTPVIAQGVLAYCGFRLVRAMASLPVPAFKTEGPLWLQDLTLSDPYLILPIAMAGSIHLLVRMGGETGAGAQSELNPGMQKFMLYGMPFTILLVMGWQSGALCIWFAASGAMAIGQSLLLRLPAVRNYLGIAPLYKPPKSEMDSGLSGLFSSSKKTVDPEPLTSAPLAKNAVYMNPTYQSPNLRRSSSSRTRNEPGEVIDVQAVTTVQDSPLTAPPPPARPAPKSGSDMIQPHRPSTSVVDEVSRAWNKAREGKAGARAKDGRKPAKAFGKPKSGHRGKGP